MWTDSCCVSNEFVEVVHVALEQTAHRLRRILESVIMKGRHGSTIVHYSRGFRESDGDLPHRPKGFRAKGATTNHCRQSVDTRTPRPRTRGTRSAADYRREALSGIGVTPFPVCNRNSARCFPCKPIHCSLKSRCFTNTIRSPASPRIARMMAS